MNEPELRLLAGSLEQQGHRPDTAAFFETLFALSNGTLGVRATVDPDSRHALPGAFNAALYAPGATVPWEIVNLPNWWTIRVRAPDASPLALDGGALEEFSRVLDYRQAELTSRLRIELGVGLTVDLVLHQIVHARHPWLTMTYGTVTAVRGSGACRIDALLDWRHGNMYGGGHTPSTRFHHCELHSYACDQTNGVALTALVRGTGDSVEIASHTTIPRGSDWQQLGGWNLGGESMRIDLSPDETVHLERLTVCAVSSPAGEPVAQALLNTARAEGTATLLASHRSAWAKRWQAADCEIAGDTAANARLQFCRFHLLQSMPAEGDDVNIAARGLTSEYHSGHFFFNTEVFKFPFFLYAAPDRARALLHHRYLRLNSAKRHAVESGASGARFPEEGAPDGSPATPWRIDDIYTRSFAIEWSGEKTKFISALVAIAADAYVRATRDAEFAMAEVLPLLVETARYGASLLAQRSDGSYSIEDVMCADEYHYGATDDAFTNETVRRNLVLAVDACTGPGHYERPGRAAALRELGVEPDEVSRWSRYASLLRRPASFGAGVLEQFEGYSTLPDAVVHERDQNGRPIMDAGTRKAADGLECFANRLIKEGDVVLLHDLLPDAFDTEQHRRDFAFYEPRTTMESSLAAVPYALVAARLGDAAAAARLFALSVGYNLDYQPRQN